MSKKAVLVIFATILVLGYGVFQWQMPKHEKDVELGGSTGQSNVLVPVTLPKQFSDSAIRGRRIFEANCASCHGKNAAGQEGKAPPLIHKIYEPSHHGDESFQSAAALGVRAHHWPFGNMPPIEGLTRAEISSIVTYVRELQRANGIN